MIDERKAKNIVESEYGDGRKVKPLGDKGRAFVFLCENKNPNIIPSKIVVAVNKETGKIGASIHSENDAIKGCM